MALLPVLLGAQLCLACAGNDGAASTSSPARTTTRPSEPAKPSSAAVVAASRRRVGRMILIAVPMLQIDFNQNADGYLAAANSCAGSQTNGSGFLACIQASAGGSEVVDDGPPMTDPLDLWRTAETDLGNVDTGLADSGLLSAACRAGLNNDGRTEGNVDQLIWTTYRAGAGGDFHLVRTLTEPWRIHVLDERSRYADLRVIHDCVPQ